MALLSIFNLNVWFKTAAGVVKANDGIDLMIDENEIVGIIGETGCGKTILGHALVRLLPSNALMGGQIVYRSRNILTLPEKEMQKIRGRQIAMIFQNPRLALNPVMTVYDQIMEVYRYRLGTAPDEIKAAVARVLETVEIDPKRMKGYPHQFSGGMIQRVMVAMAIAFNPALLVADEITKGLDLPVKWKIVQQLKRVTKGRSMLLITHDLDVAKRLCDRIAVMYAGEIVEINHTEAIFSNPAHPYTRGLMNALPSSGMLAIAGHTPSLTDLPQGCRFHPRCKMKKPPCLRCHPQMQESGKDGYVRCFETLGLYAGAGS
ncbi:MAG: ABC transporter ATP-binding protein [Desulfobacteraceae bacterium]